MTKGEFFYVVCNYFGVGFSLCIYGNTNNLLLLLYDPPMHL